jgi:CRP-like cAMP-binding protein
VARDTYLEHLKSVPLLAECSKSELQAIASVADEITFPAGGVLVRQGDLGTELFIIVSGTATVEQDGLTIATLGSGEFVGELAVLCDSRRNATVTAVSDLSILVLTRRGLNQVLDDVPDLAKHLLYSVAARLAPFP